MRMSDEIRGLDEYQARCIWTAKDQMSQRDTHMSWSLAIAGEAGELANLTKKVFVHGHAYDQDRVVDELGDILWYIAVYADALGVPLSEVAERNLAKVARRYPNGFSTEASVHRKES